MLGRDNFELASSFKLNYIIRSTRDVYIVPHHLNVPNFITRRRVEGEAVMLSASGAPTLPLEGRIACIENADPGFDWIFTKGIIGLVTKYGGTNSHMAIRCAEFGLPAAIGCGEVLFEKVRAAGRCEINGSDKLIGFPPGIHARFGIRRQ
ncbi:MAG: PEP-utilizing enzyme [Thermodesulfobacteriota bacterium]